MEQYSYALLMENVPSRYLHQVPTKLKSEFIKSKYALIEKLVFDDKGEEVNKIVYSDDLPKLKDDLLKYKSWYDYIEMKTKSLNQYVTNIY